jgi:hypothetical protein
MVKNSVETAISPTAGVFFDTINASLADLGNWVIANQDAVIGFFVGLGNAAINATEFIVNSMGAAARALGEIIAPIGDSQGLLLKFQAFQEELAGDDEYAAQLREEAEGYFSMGDGLKAFADRAETFSADTLRATLSDAGEKAKAAAAETSAFGAQVDNLNGKGVSVPIEVAGIDAASRELDDFFAKYNQMSINPQLGDPLGVTAGGLLGADVVNPSGMGVGRTGSESGLTQTSTNAKRAIENAFPAIQSIGGWRPQDGYNEHFSGQALDIMIPDWGSATGKAYGDKVAKYLLSNASALGVDYVLWQQRQWNADGTSSPMGDRGSPTENHMDHVHAHTIKSPQLPGASPPSAPAAASTSATPTGAQPSMVPGLDTSASPSSPSSSPALDMSKLNTQVAQQTTKATDQVKKAMGGNGSGGMGNLGGLGSIASSFLGDTFGIGSWLPDLANLMPLQMADGLMSSFMGPLTGFMQGGLGIQTPGWTPGMSADQFAQLSGGTTTNAPFGIPEIGAPPMPAGNAHGGSGGAPGPGNVIHIDQSQNFNNSPVGSDPAQVEKQRQNNINRAPRLPVGMG